LHFEERQKKDRKDMSRSESADDNLGATTDVAAGPQQVRGQTDKGEIDSPVLETSVI